jgi:hypothetical protein
MKTRGLTKRAEDMGVPDDSIDQAMDGKDPKSSLVELVLPMLCAVSRNDPDVTSQQADIQARRSELQKMTLRALTKHADEVDLADEKIERAMDSDDPKHALIELLLSVPAAKTQQPSKPHFGSFQSRSSKHVMPPKHMPPTHTLRTTLDVVELMALPAPEVGYVYSTEDAEAAKLREELQAMKIMALRSHALAEGVSPDAVEDAMEGDRPKRQLVQLLVCKLAAQREQRQQLREEELQDFGLRELRRRARTAGVDEERLEDTVETSDPKRAVIALILGQVSEGVPPG